MSKPVVGVDIDGTIHNLYILANRRASEITKVSISMEDWGDDYYYLRNRFGDDVAEESFRYATEPVHYSSRRLYPYVRSSLYEIGDFARVHFVTHNKDEGRREPLKRWLKNTLPDLDFGFSLTITWDKNRTLARIGAVAMIDDRPATLVDAGRRGLWVGTKVQTWNRHVIGPHPEGFEIHGFNSWRNAPALIEEAVHARVMAQ